VALPLEPPEWYPYYPPYGPTEESGWTLRCEDLKGVPVIGEGLAWFCEALTDFWNFIQGIPSTLAEIPQRIGEFIAGFPSWIVQGITSGITGLVEPLFSAVEEQTLSELPDVLQTAQFYVAAPERAPAIGYAVAPPAGGYGGLREVDWLDLFLSYLSPSALLAEAMLRYVFEYEPPATPEKARLAMARYMTANFWLGVAPTAALAVIDLFHPLKRTWIPEIWRSFYFSLGLNWMTWTIWSQVMRHTILNPMELYYAERYRDHWPSRTEFEEWYRKGIISIDEFRDGLAKLGYRDEHIRYHEEALWRDIPESALVEMWRMGIIDDVELWLRLSHLGYKLDDVNLLVQRYRAKLNEKAREESKSLIIRAYRLGILPREEAIERLVQLGYRREAAELELRVVEAEEAQDLRELQMKIILEDLKDGYIDVGACADSLQRLGVEPTKAWYMCQLEYARRRGVNREKITKSDIRTLFLHGVITREQAAEWLQRLGYSAEVAADIVTVWHLDATTKERELTRSIIERAYRLGILPREVAKAQLRRLGYTDEAAELILRIIDTQRDLDLAELRQKIVLEDLKDGYITAEEAVTRLRELGVSPETARALVELTLARKRAELRERYTKADVRSMFIHGMITKDEAVRMLANLGYAESVAAALVKIWEAESAEEPRKLTSSQVIRAYSLGLITREEALKLLQSLGYTAEYAELLIRIEEAKELQELQEDRIKLVLEDLKDGVITDEEAVRALESLGVRPERARALVELTLARKRVERRERLTKGDIQSLFRHGLVTPSQAKLLLQQIGYAETVAEALVRAWQMDLAEKTKELTTSQILRLYRTGIVSRSEALGMLQQIGYPAQTAELLLRLEDANVRADLVELQQRIILEDLKDGVITPEEAVRLLVSAGVDEAKARLLVQLELARIRGPERPKVSVSRIERWFKLGLLNEATAREWLRRLGYSDEVVELFIREWKSEEHPEARGLSTSQVLRAYRIGVLDRMMAKNWLLTMGYSEDAAELLLRIEDANEIQDLIEEKSRAILYRFRYGVITEEQAREELMNLGLAPARVDALIEIEKARRERPPEPRRLTTSQVLRACREGIMSIEDTDRYLESLGYYDPNDRLILIYLYCYMPAAGE